MPFVPMRRFLPTSAPSGGINPGRMVSSSIDLTGLVSGVQMARQGIEQQQAATAREMEIEARHREVADQAEARAQYLSMKDLLADSFEEYQAGILDGTQDKTSAQTKWAERTKALVDLGIEKVPPSQRQQVQASITADGARFERLVGRVVAKRDRQDIGSAIDSQLEYAARMSEVNPAGARHMAMQTLMELGPFAGLTSQQVQTKANAWREEAAYTQGLRMISRAKLDNAALSTADGVIQDMGDLDPRRKVELTDRIAGYKASNEQRAEMDAIRRERAAERALRVAEHSANALQGLADRGGFIAPEEYDKAISATKGTPYAAVVRAIAEQAKETGGLALQPQSTIDATLAQIDRKIAAEGRSEALQKRRDAVQKVNDLRREDIGRDALAAYAERGGGVPPALDVSSIDAVMQGLPARADHAATVSRWAGRGVSPLSPSEAERVADQLAALPVAQRAARLTQLSGGMSSAQAQALAHQIAPKDRALALALAAGTQQSPMQRRMLSADVPPQPVGELILRGAQRLADAKEPAPGSRGDQIRQALRAEIVRHLGDAVSGTRAREDVIDAAILIQSGLEATGAGAGGQKALEIALGGPLVEHAGKRIPVPAGVDNLPDRLAKYPVQAIASQAPDGFVYLPGGRPMGVPEFLGVLPTAQLEPAGLGRYFVRSGGSLVVNQNRAPIVVEVRQ